MAGDQKIQKAILIKQKFRLLEGSPHWCKDIPSSPEYKKVTLAHFGNLAKSVGYTLPN